jgi:hypothetical protein
VQELHSGSTIIGQQPTSAGILDSNSLSWHSAKGTCADGAPAMLQENSGFMVLVEKMNPNVTPSQRALQQHASAMKTLRSYLRDMFNIIIQAVNFIQGHRTIMSSKVLHRGLV